MKRLLWFFCLFLFMLPVKGQEAPDLSKFKTLNEKVDAWRLYCNKLLTETFEYRKLIGEAQKGLLLIPDDSIAKKAMFNLFTGCAYENTNQFDSSVFFLKRAADLSRKINKTSYEIIALSRLNYVYGYLRNTVMVNNTVKRMTEIGNKSTDVSTRQLAMEAVAKYYTDINNYEKAIEYSVIATDLYKEALKTDPLVTSTINLGYDYSNLANLFNQTGQHAKALDYLEQARSIIGDRALTGNEETLYLYFLQAYLGLNQPDSAQYYYRLMYAGMAGRDTLFYMLGTANFLYGNYYLNKNNIDSAYYYGKKSKALALKTEEVGALIQTSELLGNVYYQQGKYNEALKELNSILNYSFAFHKEAYAGLHKTIADCYAKQSQWDSAYVHFKLYSEISDTLMHAAANKNFADAEAKFQNKEKQQEIISKNLKLSVAQKEKIWLISGISLLTLSGLLLFINFRNKKKLAGLLLEKNNSLEQLNTRLNEANQTKVKLFSIISHDLRSPISQVYQFLKLQQLNPDALSAEQKTVLSEKIQTATGSLLETMEDLLNWSKTQMNTFNIDIQEIEIAPVIYACQNLLQLNSEAKHIIYQHELPENLVAKTDSYYLQTIIRNLLQNAIKASPQNGIIKINAGRHEEQVIINIQNQGGAYTQKEYEAFISDSETAKSVNGLGLRLVHELSQKTGMAIHFSTPVADTTQVSISIKTS
jgi:signal transduction histidine kinase